MENPNLAGNPDTYRGTYWYYGPGDNGGVHTNSGVQNYWFYLLSVGGTGVNDNGDSYSVTGIGIDDAIEIAYRNLTVYLTPTSEYLQARQGSINAAEDLFGIGSQQYSSVIDSWNAVGVNAVLAYFAANVTGGQAPLTVEFTDLSTSSPGTINSWQWDFNDDGIIDATEQNPSWTYTETGKYTVSLTVSDGTNTSSFTKTDYIVLFNPGDILVWEGVPDGANYSGTFIRDFLLSKNLNVIYLTSREIPFPLTGSKAVFLSFGNYGHSGSTSTPFIDWNAEAIKSYLQAGESRVYLEGGDVLGFDQAGSYDLFTLLGISDVQDGSSANNPITNLVGQAGTLTDGMFFDSSSQPNNNFIDIFTPNAWGKVSFIDTTLGNVAVQNVGVFGQKSFCFSYALAKLNDGTSPNTKTELLTKILNFFDIIISVEAETDVSIPFTFSLEQNYPNPFNPSTIIKYSIPQSSQVQIKIYDVLGNEIETLVNEEKPEGTYEVEFNSHSGNVRNLTSGVYFYKLQAGTYVETKKMVFLK